MEVDEDGFELAGDVDSVELVKSAVRWRKCSNVSPEGSLKRFPDSRKSVRQGKRLVGIAPLYLNEDQ